MNSNDAYVPVEVDNPGWRLVTTPLRERNPPPPRLWIPDAAFDELSFFKGALTGSLIDELYRRHPEIVGPIKDEIELLELRDMRRD